MNNVTGRAKEILEGRETSLDEIKDLTKTLKGDLAFGVARKLLAKGREKYPEDVWIRQQLALCTYKDEELHPTSRFADALVILEEISLRNPSNTNAETLALGGAVYKRMWEYGGQLENLYEALSFYRAAHERNPEDDLGYGGVNAAYILQLLASRARVTAMRAGTPTVETQQLEQQAKALREDMLGRLLSLAEMDPGLKQQNWFVVTMAEIHLGLGNYDEAGTWLGRARVLGATEWEKQTTFRQMVSIARLQGVELPKENSDPGSWHPAWQALTQMLGEGTARALTCYRGKIGLGLSGGGIRASLFHIGVLARLAEMDVLRSVEILSTVSGGSIVGAHYYLEVRNLLQTKPDERITREDYIEIVRHVQQDFLAGVQKNLRTRTLASFGKNLKMIFSKSYSRSHRIGELYEEELYAKVKDGRPTGRPRYMSDLLITPANEQVNGRFRPRFSNWRRRAKVPILLLNTTSLNSGHNWHFTATWMGEPPGLLGGEVDKNERYRRLYYNQAPTEELQNYRLGYAVAASACVPGLFEPLVIRDLYPDDRVVRLVDGGVHDNQGAQGLLDEGCTLILCSDSSGQMEDQRQPSNSLLGVPLRSNSILMDRVREVEYQDLRGRLDSRALDGLFFIHLKKDLSVPPVDWVDCQDPTPKPASKDTKAPYGIDVDVQKKLAAIRTDLDSFSEVEAHALMLSGYLMTEYEFKELQKGHEKDGELGTWGGFDIHANREDWPFLKLEPIMRQPKESADPRRKDLGQQLEVASSLFFKVWQLIPALRWASWVLATVAIVGILWLIVYYWNQHFTITVQWMVITLAVAIAGLMIPMLKWFSPQKAWQDVVSKMAAAFVGYVLTKVHLLVFDRLFLKCGSLKRLFDLQSDHRR